MNMYTHHCTRTQLNQRPLCCTSTHAAGVSSAKKVDILRAAVDRDIVTSDEWYFNMTTTIVNSSIGRKGRRIGDRGTDVHSTSQLRCLC